MELLFLESLVYSFVFIFLNYITGDILFKKVSPSYSPQENQYINFFLKTASGMSINAFVVFCIAISGYFYIIALLPIYFFVIIYWRTFVVREINFSKSLKEAILNNKYEFLFFIFFSVAILAKSFKPAFAWDETMYHLPLAKFYSENHKLILNQYIRFPLFPQAMELFFTIGMLLKNDIFARQIANIPFFLICVGLCSISKKYSNNILYGLISILLLLAIKPLRASLGNAYVDLSLSVFVFAMIFSSAYLILDTKNAKFWLVLSILFGTTVASIKYSGLVVILINSFLLLLFKDKKTFTYYSLGILFFGSIWYVRNFFISGNPIHPAGGEFFGYFIWDRSDVISATFEQSTHGVPINIFNIPKSLIKASSSVLLIPLFLVFLIAKKNLMNKYLSAFFILYFLFWFFVTQVDRFLSPIWIVGIFMLELFLINFTSCPSFFRGLYEQRLYKKAFCLLSFLVLCFTIPGARIYSKDSWEKKLSEQPGYLVFKKLNAINSNNTKIIQVGLENAIYYSNNVVIGDWYGYGRYSQFLDCPRDCHSIIAPEAMAKKMASFDAEFLAVNFKRFDFDVMAYVDYFDVVFQTNDSILLRVK